MKALMFGGAFNPPTKAHIELADDVRKQLGYDKVIFVPTQLHYITQEQKKDFAFSDEQRLKMLNQIASDRDWMIVSDYEIHSPSQPRSYTTLCHLKAQYETEALQLLFGSDKLEELEHGWRHVEEICHEFGIVCMARTTDHPEEIIAQSAYLSSLQDCISVVYMNEAYLHYSSTQVRKAYMAMKSAWMEIQEMTPHELNGLWEELGKESR